jgi:hypothetical protein
MFFVVLAALSFFTLAKRTLSPVASLWTSAALGISLAAALATKVTGALLFILLPLILALKKLPLKVRITSIVVASLSCLVLYFGIWRVHFLLGEHRIPELPDKGYFSLAQDVKTIVDTNQQTTLSSFPRMWWENAVVYISRYADGVPKLDLSKSDENGSPVFFWPFGARAIQYRWEAAPHNSVRYLFLVSNPFSWTLVLGSIALCGALLTARLVFPSSVKLKNPLALLVLATLYFGYLIGVGQISRVMYLYHYFMPLIFGFLLAGLTINEVDTIGSFTLTARRKTALAGLGILGTFLTFLWYSPLTYYKPLTDHQVRSRAIVSLWDLTCAGCPRTNKLAQPPTPTLLTVRFGISELAPEELQQDWGQPQIGVSATGQPLIHSGIEYPTAFGMHSNSIASYPVYKQYSRITGDAGLPDYLKDSEASVIFQIIGDEKVLWESPVIKPGAPLAHFDSDISDVEHLILKVLDADDGIADDHGFWANVALTKKPGSDIKPFIPPPMSTLSKP